MANIAKITSYRALIAASSKGFNEWKRNIYVRTDEPGVSADIRFVTDPADRPYERVEEDGISLLYLSVDEYDSVLHLLQSEEPLYLVLYGNSDRALIQTTNEPPGELEPEA